MATREDCLRALEEAATRLDGSPTKSEYEQLDITPPSTILRHFSGWNAAKDRAGLDTNASTGSRVEPKPDDVSLPDGVEWASLSQDQRWHYRNHEQNARRSRARRQRLRKWLHEIKANESGCTRCGESGPSCLDFHHRDDATKDSNVNELVASGYSKDAIRAEIDGCELLCANRHWREHHTSPAILSEIDASVLDERPYAALENTLLDAETTPYDKEQWVRAWTYAYQRTRGCQGCGEPNPVCLQFHHDSDDKTMGVGEMISKSRPVEDVVAEIGKTTVLCANCHRTEHQQATGQLLD